MDLLDAIHHRRSIKRFTDRPVTPDEIDTLLDAAAQAPNHRRTEPWRFFVVGPEGRRAFGRVLGGRKARRVEDPEAARAVVDKVEAAHAALPAFVVVATVLDDNPEIRDEDTAACWMAVQNLSLAAEALGLGTHIKTGAVMDDPGARAAFRVPEGLRVVAMVEVGEPAERPDPWDRTPASAFTTRVP